MSQYSKYPSPGGGGSGITQLTGDVTAGPGSGSQSATIAANSVSYAKMQQVSAGSRVLGRGDSGAGNVQELSLGSGLSITGTVLSLSSPLYSFTIFQTDFGTYPTASSASDTLTFTSGDSSISITGDSTTDTIDIRVVGGSGLTNQQVLARSFAGC